MLKQSVSVKSAEHPHTHPPPTDVTRFTSNLRLQLLLVTMINGPVGSKADGSVGKVKTPFFKQSATIYCVDSFIWDSFRGGGLHHPGFQLNVTSLHQNITATSPSFPKKVTAADSAQFIISCKQDMMQSASNFFYFLCETQFGGTVNIKGCPPPQPAY